MKSCTKKTILYGLILILLALLCIQFPYVSDDWLWGTDARISTFFDSFSNPENPWHFYNNGRYLGNFLGFLAANHLGLRVFLMSGTLTMIVFFIVAIARPRRSDGKNRGFLSDLFFTGFCLLLLLICSRNRFRQSLAWSSAFMIYVIPSMLLLACFRLLFSPMSCRPGKLILFFLLPFCASFFSENLSIGNFIFILILIGRRLIRKESVRLPQILYLSGALLGMILMLSDDGYQAILQDNASQTYWSAPIHSLRSMLVMARTNFLNVMVFELLTDNPLLNLLTCGTLVLLVGQRLRNKPLGKISTALLSGACIINCAIAIYGLLRALNPSWQVLFGSTKLFEALLAVFWYLNLMLILLLTVDSPERRDRMSAELLFLFCITAPLLAASPLSGRVFFPMYTFLMLFCAEGLGAFLQQRKSYACSRLPVLICCTLCVVNYLFLFSIYGVIHHYDQQRQTWMQEQDREGNSIIMVPKLPYEEYLILSVPYDQWEDRFKQFYGIRGEAELHLIEFDEWMEIIQRL